MSIKTSAKKGAMKTTSPKVSVKREVEKLLKDEKIKNELLKLGGERTLEVMKLLTKYSEDEEIADKLNVKVSDVRAVLNKLNEAGIATYERTKDPETGWYYYHWSIHPNKVREWYDGKINAQLNYLYSLLSEGEHYYCPKCGIEQAYNFSEAMDNEFKCPYHGEELKPIDEAVINRYKKKLLK